MNEHLRLSREGAGLVKVFENCLKRMPDGRFKPYLCPAGVLTIGWGHTNHHGRTFDANSRWTQAECDAAFEEDMVGFEAAVHRLVKVALNQQQFDALVSFAYNCGEGNLGSSTLLKKVNRRDFEGAAREFARWNKGGGKVLAGLVRRRASEALLFQGIADRNYDGRADAVQPARVAEPAAVDSPSPEVEPEAMPQAVDPPAPAKGMAQSSIGGSAIAGGAGTAVTAGGAVIKAIADDPPAAAPDASSIGDLLDKAGNMADAAGRIAQGAPSPSALKTVLHVITDPLVIALVGAVTLPFLGYIWWERRRKLHEEGV